MIIPRQLFYDILTKINSPNLSYVEEINGFKKSKNDVNLHEVMKRLDIFDIIALLDAMNEIDKAKILFNIFCDYAGCLWDGFDCYLEYNFKRDYIIKKVLKDEDVSYVSEMYGTIEDRTNISINMVNKINTSSSFNR